MADIVAVMARISHEFQQLGLAVPEAILLKNREEGMHFCYQLQKHTKFWLPRNDAGVGKSVEHPDGSVWMEAEVYGIKVRWPAEKMALRSGGYVFI